ncbi:MAG: L-seryl-tRNA(Sec) selenium transferase [Acidobacteriota bacterium]
MSTLPLRSLPSIERLLASPVAVLVAADIGRAHVRDLLREISAELRNEITTSLINGHSDTEQSVSLADSLTAEIEHRLKGRAALCAQPSLRRVINATGVIIHTNLGRSPLARAAIDAIADVASHYSNLEYDLSRGQRGHRESHCQQLLARLTGSEAAVVANNNAAAVLLVLNTLAEGAEVIASRGELVEIGGSFRIPDVMEKSGARLREVGTTNRTRISDYESAINPNTKLILRVHPSNYRIIGFTERPSVLEIADLARRAGIPSFEDLGSGCLIDVGKYGVAGEPVVSESLKAGVSIVSFSGDKMLGGPQAGIIAGSHTMVDRVLKNPLMRALRVDKLTYAALEATLRLYERGVAESEVPIIHAMAATADRIAERAAQLIDRIEEATDGRIRARLQQGESVVGAGSAPGITLATTLMALEHEELSPGSIQEELRKHDIPVIVRVERDRVVIDLRTVAAEEEAIIVDALASLARSESKKLVSLADSREPGPALATGISL